MIVDRFAYRSGFLGNARIPSDSNRRKSALRVVNVGRRNFLFVGMRKRQGGCAALTGEIRVGYVW
jgi:hypothetical protein